VKEGDTDWGTNSFPQPGETRHEGKPITEKEQGRGDWSETLCSDYEQRESRESYHTDGEGEAKKRLRLAVPT